MIICWNKTIDAEFRADYLDETSEAIQEHPKENADQTWYKIGSWRITDVQANALKAIYGDDMSIGEPDGWKDYVASEDL